jgi:hypothetical protein
MATGWGNKLWGEDSWGDLSDATALPSGQQLSLSVDQVTNTGDSNVDVTGLQITSTIGDIFVRFDAGVFPTGTQSSVTLGTTTEVIIDHEVLLTGSSASLNIGVVTADAELQVGWGGDTWGENAWGDLSGAFANPTGIQAAYSIGSVTTTANADIDVTGIQLTATNAGATGGASVAVIPTGQQMTLGIGEEVINIGVPVTGSQATTSAGQTTIDPTYLIGAGWGRDTFGNLGWGVNYSVIPAEGTGIELTASLGDELAITDVEVTVTAPDALQITYASPSFSIQIDQDIFVLASEDQLDAEIGTIADVTGTALVEPTNQEPLFNFTAEGNAQLSTAQAKFGSSSLLLDGTDDYVDTTTNLDLSSGDFTVDVWIRPDNVTGYKGIWQSGTSTTEQSYLLGNQVYWTVNPSTIITTSVTVNANEWTMLSYEREGNTHRIYKNGTLEDTATTANKQDNGVFSIGKNGFGDFDGYIDEFRVSDIARYGGSSFTEPTQAFSFDSDTQFLLHFDGANGSTVIKSADDTLFQGTFSQGQTVAGLLTEVPVTGVELTSTIGDISLQQSTNEPVIGQELTTSIGQAEEIPQQIVGVTGLELTGSVGSVTATGVANVPVTGISATISTGQVNITSWQEIDLGVNNTWTEVDLAA